MGTEGAGAHREAASLQHLERGRRGDGVAGEGRILAALAQVPGSLSHFMAVGLFPCSFLPVQLLPKWPNLGQMSPKGPNQMQIVASRCVSIRRKNLRLGRGEAGSPWGCPEQTPPQEDFHGEGERQ